jgi:hypothetical protein
VKRRLQIDDGGGGFAAELVALRRSFTAAERLVLGALGMLIAAGCLVLGWRRVGLRWVGALVLAPSLIVVVDLWLGSPIRAIAQHRLAIVSEPRAGLEPVATVRPGVEVEVLGGTEGSFVRVRAGDHTGYAPRHEVALLE